jgi:nucleoside-diphosphate-sugar epimerase
VAGASGFIGRWVAKLLSEQDADLWTVDKDEKRLSNVLETYSIEGKPIVVDLSKPNTFQELFKEIQPDIVFNLAGYGVSRLENDETAAWKINAELVETMAITIVKESKSNWKGLSFVHVGSGFEYGSIAGVITENIDPKPTTIYGKSKLAGTKKLQEVARLTGLRGVTARLFTVYGPGENPGRLLPSLLQAARTKEPLKLTKGEQQRDFTYVKDIATGLLKLGLLHDFPGQILNLATGKLTSVLDFVKCAQHLLGIPSSQLLFGSIPYREDEVWRNRADVSLLKAHVAWIPTYSILEGIQETIEHEMSK